MASDLGENGPGKKSRDYISTIRTKFPMLVFMIQNHQQTDQQTVNTNIKHDTNTGIFNFVQVSHRVGMWNVEY